MALDAVGHGAASTLERVSCCTRAFSRMESGSIRGSVFALCSSVVGSGVLVLPYTMMELGPLLAYVLLAIAATASYVSLCICCAGMCATDTYSYVEMLLTLFSEGFAILLIGVLVIACFGISCGHLVLATQLFLELMHSVNVPERLCSRGLVTSLLACFPIFPLSLFRNLSNFRHFTTVTILAVSYLTLLVIARSPHYQASADLESGWWWRIADVWQAPKCLSICFYAYTMHMNVFICYKELQDPTTQRVRKVLTRSTLVQTLLYATIAFFSFISFGAQTPDNMMAGYNKGDVFANLGRLFLSCQLLLAIPLTVQPGRTYLWPLWCFVLKWRCSGPVSTSDIGGVQFVQTAPRAVTGAREAVRPLPLSSLRESDNLPLEDNSVSVSEFDDGPSAVILEGIYQVMPLPAHIIITSGFVFLVTIVVILVPSVSDLIALVGGFACVTYIFVLPVAIALKLRSIPEALSETSVAAFVAGQNGTFIILFLIICSALGYIAAAQSCWRIVVGSVG